MAYLSRSVAEGSLNPDSAVKLKMGLSQGETEAVVLTRGWENYRSILYSRAPARSVRLQHAMALRDVLPEYPAPFAREGAGRPLPRGFDLCSLPALGKSL